MRKFNKKIDDKMSSVYDHIYNVYGLYNVDGDELCGNFFFANSDKHAIQKIEMDMKRTPIDVDVKLFKYGNFSNLYNKFDLEVSPICIWTNFEDEQEEKN